MEAKIIREIAPAPLSLRVMAFVADFAVVYALCKVPIWTGMTDAGFAGGVILAFVYIIARDSFWGGASLGKKLFRLRVLKYDGLSPAGIRESFRRNGLLLLCFLLVDSALTVLGIGPELLLSFIAAGAFCFRYIEKSKRRTKMDMFGGTVVVTLR